MALFPCAMQYILTAYLFYSQQFVLSSLSCVQLFVTLWTLAHQAPISMKFSKQEYWKEQPFPSPGDLPDPEIEPRSPALQADSLPSEPHLASLPFPFSTGKHQFIIYICESVFLLLYSLNFFTFQISHLRDVIQYLSF